MKINIKKLIISILIPVGLGAIVGILTSGFGNYNTLVQPVFAPPAILFPIVWTILYTLMGISFYMIDESNSYDKNSAKKVYFIQLFINLTWSFFFFTFKMYLFSFIWILLLIATVAIMIKKFYSINKVSGLIQIPYLIWLIFASILNFAIYTLN